MPSFLAGDGTQYDDIRGIHAKTIRSPLATSPKKNSPNELDSIAIAPAPTPEDSACPNIGDTTSSERCVF